MTTGIRKSRRKGTDIGRPRAVRSTGCVYHPTCSSCPFEDCKASYKTLGKKAS